MKKFWRRLWYTPWGREYIEFDLAMKLTDKSAKRNKELLRRLS